MVGCNTIDAEAWSSSPGGQGISTIAHIGTAARSDATVDRARANPGGRIRWLNAAKGAGIIVVVLGHALGGVIDSPLAGHHPGLRQAFLAIYIFHMPLFFLLAGLLVRVRLARGRKRFAGELLRTIVVPYFLWSTIQYALIYAAGSLVNRPVDRFWPAIIGLTVHPVSQFWFLYVLLLLHIAALVVVPRAGSAVLLAGAIAAKLALPILPFTGMIRLALVHAPFYAVGVALGVDGIGRLLSMPDRRVRAVLAIAAPAVIAIAAGAIMARHGPAFGGYASPKIAALAWALPVAPAAACAIAGWLCLCHDLPGRAGHLLAALGRNAMSIYVLHIVFIAGTRILIGRLVHPASTIVVLAAATAAGIAGPLLVTALCRRAGAARWLGLGG